MVEVLRALSRVAGKVERAERVTQWLDAGVGKDGGRIKGDTCCLICREELVYKKGGERWSDTHATACTCVPS
jgi:hypothetical protein